MRTGVEEASKPVAAYGTEDRQRRRKSEAHKEPYGGVRDHVTIFTPAGNILNGDRSSIKTGYAFGGGVAYAIPTTSFLKFFHSSAVTLKVEYIHYDLGRSDIPVINLTGMVPIGTHIATEGYLIRAGLDYKFDFFIPSAPVAAKY